MKWSGNSKHFYKNVYTMFRIFHFRIFILWLYIIKKSDNRNIEISVKKRSSDVEIVIWCLLTISLNDLWAQLILSAIFNCKWPLEIVITYVIIFAHNIKIRKKKSLKSLYFSTYFPFKHFTLIPIINKLQSYKKSL